MARAAVVGPTRNLPAHSGSHPKYTSAAWEMAEGVWQDLIEDFGDDSRIPDAVWDLIDESGTCFARVKAPRWRLWTFPIRSEDGVTSGTISRPAPRR